MLHHASDSIRFDFYHQTETEEVLLQPFIESVVGTNPSTMEEAVYLKVSKMEVLFASRQIIFCLRFTTPFTMCNEP